MSLSPTLPIPAEGTTATPARCSACGARVQVVKININHGMGRGAAFVMPTPKMPLGTPGRACPHEGAEVLTVAKFERLGKA